MANPQKNKGDRAEREAVAYLVDTVPDLVRPYAKRNLSAGRREDEGDLYVLEHAAVQVKNYKLATIGQAIRVSALDSVSQARADNMLTGVGMVKYPNARKGTVGWLAAWLPGDHISLPEGVEPIEFKMVGKALTWLRDDVGPYGYEARPRETRIAVLPNPQPAVYVAPFEAWLGLYRHAFYPDGTNFVPLGKAA